MDMEANHIAALQEPSPIKATLVRFDLPGSPLCLTDGGFSLFDAGEGQGVEVYVDAHPVYGVLDSVPSVTDGAEAETPRLDIVILPATNEGAVALASPTIQGIRVQWWEAVVDWNTGGLLGQPLLKFDGELDRARLTVGENWSLALECGTQSERQLEPNEDWRLNDAFHRVCWPAEAGLSNVTNVTVKDEWRSRPENPGLFKRLLKTFVPISNL
ncbi:MAG: hypothetical protein ACK4JY_03770 [Brevundimonas sp.]|uniref:hypothetical protein n=1 Tax=Brevundimonas sp. TaxID=1871086 RepID=UPI00391CF1B0